MSSERRGAFAAAGKYPPNAIFNLTARFNADKHPDKLNLGEEARCAPDRFVLATLCSFSAPLHPFLLATNDLKQNCVYYFHTGVGAYRDAALRPYVFEVVKEVQRLA